MEKGLVGLVVKLSGNRISQNAAIIIIIISFTVLVASVAFIILSSTKNNETGNTGIQSHLK